VADRVAIAFECILAIHCPYIDCTLFFLLFKNPILLIIRFQRNAKTNCCLLAVFIFGYSILIILLRVNVR